MYLVIYMKQKHEQEIALDIDYDLFTTEEIVKIFEENKTEQLNEL